MRGLTRAIAAHRQGRLAEAAALYRDVLARDPGHARAMALLGALELQRGRVAEAEALLADALRRDPADAEARANHATALGLLGRPAEALAALEAVPGEALLAEQGRLLAELGRFAEALTILDRATPTAEALASRGLALAGLARPADALAAFDAALALRPGHARTLYNRANALADLGQADAALAGYDQAIAHKPDYAQALNNRGSLLVDMQRLPEAAISFARSLAIRPNDGETRFNDGLLRLMRGDWQRGWEGFEARWRSGAHKGLARDTPPWRGEDIAGRTILLNAEQGFGDTLQFCRYVPLVAARGARVVLEVQPPLVRLLSGLGTVVARGDPLPPFDVQCPLMSLPRAFGTTEATIPAAVPYLTAAPRPVAGGRPRIGLAWSGNAAHRNDSRRSLPAAMLAPLLGVAGTVFSLQRDLRPDDAAWVAAHLADRHFGEELRDFADTASLVAAMDLVITVDTAIAHLAGAMGKPVWILLPFRGVDWRWQLERRDSPWYPTARLFRQPAPDDWASVIAALAEDLCHFGA